MKIRRGFVSNSSSSSFIAGFPKDMSDENRKERVIEELGVDENSFFYDVAKQIADCIVDSIVIKDREEFAKENYLDSWDLIEEYEKSLFIKCEDQGFDYLTGSASNESFDDMGEMILYDRCWGVDEDDFFIVKNY
jgi:hypothetical protein